MSTNYQKFMPLRKILLRAGLILDNTCSNPFGSQYLDLLFQQSKVKRGQQIVSFGDNEWIGADNKKKRILWLLNRIIQLVYGKDGKVQSYEDLI